VAISRSGFNGKLERDFVVALVGDEAKIDTFLIPSWEPGHARR
jgi:hypothetical protein